jgi:hypothetical protein
MFQVGATGIEEEEEEEEEDEEEEEEEEEWIKLIIRFTSQIRTPVLWKP